MNALGVLVNRELRESLRGRWLVVYALSFALLAALVAWGGAEASSITGAEGFGPMVAQFIVLVMLFAPLMGLTLGAQSIVRDRERGVTAYVLAQPVSSAQYFAAKAIALAIALCAAVLFGFAIGALVMGALGEGGALADFAVLLGLTWLLTVTMAMIGMLASAFARKAPAALGAAVALWLAFTIFGDLGLMTTALATHLGIDALLFATLLNPVEAFKIAGVAQLSGSLDAFGPGGRLATDIFGVWLMPVNIMAVCLWLVAAAGATWLVFRRQDAV